MTQKKSHSLFVAAISLCWLTSPTADAGIVTLNAPPGPISVGSTFEVEVWANNGGAPVELVSFGFDVDPDNTLAAVSYNGYTMGPGATDVSDALNPKNVSGAWFPGLPAGNVLLATLSLTADAVGSDSLAVRGLADGLFYGLFYVEADPPFGDLNDDIDASVEITIVPEPASGLWTLVLLGGFALWRRSR